MRMWVHETNSNRDTFPPPLQVFTTLALVGMLILPLNSFPWVLNGTLEAKVSLDRIQRFLKLPNQDLDAYFSHGRCVCICACAA